MGRLEKQIIIGALALVGVLLTVVVFKGLKPREEVDTTAPLFIPLTAEEPAPNQPEGETERKQDPFPDFNQGGTKDSAKKTPDQGNKRVIPPVQPDVRQLPREDDLKPRIYTIRPSDTLSEIAQSELGSQRRMREILQLNPGLDPDRLVPGETLVLPSKKAKAQMKEAAALSGSGNVREAKAGRTHTVTAGDSLWSIAEQYYGKGWDVNRIVQANSSLLKSKDTVLKIGWVLNLPE